MYEVHRVVVNIRIRLVMLGKNVGSVRTDLSMWTSGTCLLHMYVRQSNQGLEIEFSAQPVMRMR